MLIHILNRAGTESWLVRVTYVGASHLLPLVESDGLTLKVAVKNALNTIREMIEDIDARQAELNR